MTELVIACEMLEDEVREAMRYAGRELPILWVDRGLHEHPDRLREGLRARIQEAEEQADTLLLTFSCCGGALCGLSSERATLIIPRFDDCIRMIKSLDHGCRDVEDCYALYLTDGWMKSDRFMHKEFQACCERYGAERARRIYKKILQHYRSFELVDTGAYDVEDCRAQAECAAVDLGLEFRIGKGTNRILRKLFSGEWDEEFLIQPPNTPVTLDQFLCIGRDPLVQAPCPSCAPPASSNQNKAGDSL